MNVIKANVNAEYDIKESEKGHVHVRCGQKVHDSEKQEYSVNYRIVKMYPSVYNKAKKRGAFKEFSKVEMIHNPELGVKKVEESGNKDVPKSELETSRNNYKLLFKEEAEEEMSIEDLNSLIARKADEIEDTVKELYFEKTSKDPEGLSVLEIVKVLDQE